jgi:hypothetical protein
LCTVIILRRPGHDWPLILASNRDELKSRPWLAPSRHWPDRTEVTAGQDHLAKGTWLGINDWGVVAGVLNRPETLGTKANKRSRGELPLEALDHAEAAIASKELCSIDPSSYQPFNLIIADRTDAYWLSSSGGNALVSASSIPVGLSMITAFNLNDETSPRIRYYKPKFETTTPPDVEIGDWNTWKKLMGDRRETQKGLEVESMTIVSNNGLETVSSSLIALPAEGRDAKPQWLFAPGRPDINAYKNIVF